MRAEPEAVAAYARVCGFALRDHLPPTYPHVLAFPLHMAVMADGSFPFGAVGLVHIENRIVQHRRIGIGEELTLARPPDQAGAAPQGPRPSPSSPRPAPAGEKVWEERQHDAAPRRAAPSSPPGAKRRAASLTHRPVGAERVGRSAEWRLGGDLGRRYAAVSGDRNPIHMHSLTAKPLGFPRRDRARDVDQGALPGGAGEPPARRLRRRGPLPQADPAARPGRVRQRTPRARRSTFAVRDAKRSTPHLDGRVEPLEAKPETRGGSAR